MGDICVDIIAKEKQKSDDESNFRALDRIKIQFYLNERFDKIQKIMNDLLLKMDYVKEKLQIRTANITRRI